MYEQFSVTELEAYLDESLAVERMAAIERALRGRPDLIQRLAEINARRDCGVHTIGEIWRRRHIGVPTRDELSQYLRGALPHDHAAYIRFRLATLECRYTAANLRDIQSQRGEAPTSAAARRRRFYDSSVEQLGE